MSFPHLLYRLAHAYPGKVTQLAKDMDIGEKVLGNKLNTNCTTHDTGVKKELEMLLDFTNGNKAAAEHFAEKANCVVVQLPAIPDLGDMGVLDAFMGIMRKLGTMSSDFQESYADGDIDTKEFKKLAADIDAIQSQLLAFKETVKRIKR